MSTTSHPKAWTVLPARVRSRRGLVAAGAAVGLVLATAAIALPEQAGASGYKEPAVEITKSAVQDETTLDKGAILLPGDTFDYLLTVTNNGGGNADRVDVVDDLPSAVAPNGDITVLDGDSVVDTLPGADPVEVVLNDLGAGETRTITVPVKVIVKAEGCSTFSNEAAATYVPSYKSVTVDSNTVTLAVGCADLLIEKVAEVDGPVAVGDEVSYSISVSLAEVDYPVAVKPVVITDTFDTDLFSFVSASDGGDYTNGTVTWTLKEGLAPGDSPEVVSLTLKVLEADNDAEYINTACVALTPDDSTPVVGTKDDCDEVPITVTEGDSSLSLIKTNDPTGTLSGYLDSTGAPRTIEYALEVTAGEGADQEGVVVTDTVPDQTELVAGTATCDGGPADCAEVDGRDISWTVGAISAGASKTVRFTVALLPPTGSDAEGGNYTIRNVAVATSTTDKTTSNPVENPVTIRPLTPTTSEECDVDTPYVSFTSKGWVASEQLTMVVLDNAAPGNLDLTDEASFGPYVIDEIPVSANAEGVVTVTDLLWPGYSAGDSYPGPEVRPLVFFLTGSGTTPSVSVPFPAGPQGCDSTLTIAKANDPTGVVAFGTTITYTLTVSVDESGAYEQTGVVVTDTIPGYDDEQPTSGITTYVPDSAICVGEPPEGGTCEVTQIKDAGTTTGLTWALGSMNPGETRQVQFAVTADEQDAVVEGSETVDFVNVSAVESVDQPSTPSNVVTNTAVITEVSDNGTDDLPATGSQLPLPKVALVGLLLIAAGAAMVRQPRRRPGRHTAH